MGSRLFTKAISIFVQNGTIRLNIYGQNVIFHRQGIFKTALTIEELLKIFHRVVGNFALG